MKKIVLIGPVYPYKGGISHYTGLMYRALASKYETCMVSYKMQYPKLLFKKEQRDYSNDQFKIEPTNFWINTANPFNCIGSARKILKAHPELVIFQWWHPYFAPCYWLMEKVLRKKTKLLFVCHNVFPHERFPMDRWLTKLVLKKVDYYIVQSKQDEQDLLAIKPEAVYRRTVHPTYNAFKIQDLQKTEARRILGISENQKILLFFGFVREYKGLKHLIHAMPKIIKELPDTRLLVVGDFAGDKDMYIQMMQEDGVADSIDIYDGYIPDQDVEKFFAASDLVVLPYESATQSGIVQIAYGFDKPVIVTEVGGLPEVVENGKTGYVVPPMDDDALAEAVCRYFKEDRADEFKEGIQAEAYRYSWDRMREVIEGFME